MGLEVLEAVDVGGTWTVTGEDDAPRPPPPKPAAPTTSSELAERPPMPAPAPAPPPNPVRATPPSKVAAPPGSGRWLIAGAIVAGVALAVPLAVAAGTFVYRVTNAPVPPAGTAHVRYLAGASSTRIEAAAASRGLRCGTPPQSVGSGGAAPVRVCQRVSGGRVASVAIATYAGHLVAVTAGVGGRPPDESNDLALLQAIIDATVARGDAGRDDAWLSAHFDQSGDSQTVVNGVMLRLMVRDAVRSFVIVPAP
jgi:hypothetical protein